MNTTASCKVATWWVMMQEVFDSLPFKHSLLHIERGSWSVQRVKNSIKVMGKVRYEYEPE